MKKSILTLVFALIATAALFAQSSPSGEPLLRMAVLSDIHNELGMISASSKSKLRLRPTFLHTLDSLKRAEKIDVLAMDGDYTSDCTISQSNWTRIREMMVEATRSFFPADAERRPVLWVTGNHDFEVANFDALPKPFNAGDYYTFPMKEDIGTLADDECFYETADNDEGTPQQLLAAFHYVVHGFDFIGINCGKHFFRSAWDYQYSQESIDWVDRKLAELTKDDPDRTIIVLAHLPLPSSVGATSNKTLSKGAASSYSLERALAKYPGVIYLYGHDHSSKENKSYYESTILQRLTFYDTAGNVIAPYGEEIGQAGTIPEAPTEGEHIFVTISNAKSGKYLGYDTYNAAVNETPNTYEIYSSTDYAHRCVIYTEQSASDAQGVLHYLYCGSSGRFSGNTALGANSTHYFYEVPDIATGTGTLVDSPEAGKTYAIVTLSSKGGYYALSDEMYSPGSASQRIVGVKVSDPNTNATQTFTAGNIFWTLTAVQTGEEDTWQDLTADFINVADGSYLGFDTNNIAVIATPNAFTVAQSTLVPGTFSVKADNGPGGGLLHCGSSGRFSGNPTLTENSSILFYEVDPETLVGTLTTAPGYGKTYALVALSSSGGYYAVTNAPYNTGGAGQRLKGSKCSNESTQTFAATTALWQMTEHHTIPGPPSYMSAFVGSMRYNQLETNATPDENDPRMIQALIVELYRDSVVLTMKNFGETGVIHGAAITARITDPLRQYVVRRDVHGTTAPDATPDAITAPSATKPRRIVTLTGVDLGEASRLHHLPAGVYIVGDRKVVVR